VPTTTPITAPPVTATPRATGTATATDQPSQPPTPGAATPRATPKPRATPAPRTSPTAEQPLPTTGTPPPNPPSGASSQGDATPNLTAAPTQGELQNTTRASLTPQLPRTGGNITPIPLLLLAGALLALIAGFAAHSYGERLRSSSAREDKRRL
jgi:hypothetical protein